MTTKLNIDGSSPNDVTAVARILDGYSKRGIFRSYSAAQPLPGKVTANLTWHYDRDYQITADVGNGTVRISPLLPEVTPSSEMYRAFKEFVEGFGSAQTVEHRRVDPTKARISTDNVRDNANFSLTVVDGDYAYATQKLTHIAHEVFLAFLPDGPYWEYRIDKLGLDPDSM